MAEVKKQTNDNEKPVKNPANDSEKGAKKVKAAKPKKPKKPLGERIKSFFRVYKSEIKKITWTPKEQVRKNSVLVFVVVLAAVVLFGVCDFVFSSGINALAQLI